MTFQNATAQNHAYTAIVCIYVKVCFRPKSHTNCTDSSTSLNPFYANSLSAPPHCPLTQQNDWNLKPCGITLPANWGNLHFPQSTICLPISHGESEAKPLFDSIRRERERDLSHTLLNFFIFQSSLTHPSALQLEIKINTRSKLVQLVIRPNTSKSHWNTARNHVWFSHAQLIISSSARFHSYVSM